MGITISYRGTLADLTRLEDMEDRIVDVALDMGAAVQVWRSASDTDPRRVVRGVILNLAPGQETTSLLVSPEGQLIPLTEIESAEAGPLAEPGWCFVKTQFGPIEGHVALVELLTALRRQFIPNLEVHDDGGYWETRNLERLRSAFARTQAAIDLLADGLQRYGLSPEAAEDRDILLARVERVARQVQRTMRRPAEHPPVEFADDDSDSDEPGSNTGLDEEATWDLLFKENRRKQERMGRAIEERLSDGATMDDAFDHALREVVPDLPDECSDDDDTGPDDDWAGDDLLELEQASDADGSGEGDTSDYPADLEGVADERNERPLQRRAGQLRQRLYELSSSHRGKSGGHWTILLRSAGEISGGLAQALGRGDDYQVMRGLRIVQLKRALRGVAFALGALPALCAAGAIDQAIYRELRDTLKSLQTDIQSELDQARNPHDSDS